MTETQSSSGSVWRYQFSEPGDTVVEEGEFDGDDSAETRARDLSRSKSTPIVVKRHNAHVDSWVYVTEVDERP
jgi:hypothetical protein